MLLHDSLDYFGRTAPNSEFAAEGERTMTYGEALAEANRIANALVGAGLQKGDRFGLLAKNSIEYALIYYGASKAGAVPVPLNFRLAPPEWQFILQDSNAKLILADTEYGEGIESIELPEVSTRIAMHGDAPAGWNAYSDWTGSASSAAPARQIEETDDVFQMYTSGTTGRPKGAVLTHYSVAANLAQFTPLCRDEWRGRVLLLPPLYHIAAACILFGSVGFGESILVQRDFVPAAAVDAMSRQGVGFVMAVPAIIQACLAAVPDVASRDYSRLRCIGYGGSAIAEVTLRRALEVFGCAFFQGYGMTEASPLLTMLTPADHRRALADSPGLILSAGRAAPGTDLQIWNTNDEQAKPGEIGEIVARGPQLMRGYWNRPEATAETLRDGWLHTGDAATMDDEGYVYIQDRVKDMIVSGGENIYPREVEEVLFQHPAVGDVAVIGVPDAQWGETVKAVLVGKSDDRPSDDEVVAFCRQSLGGYKVPRSIDWVDELPRNPSGKVLKRELREQYWEGQTRRVGGN